jgi:hypothetical protein
MATQPTIPGLARGLREVAKAVLVMMDTCCECDARTDRPHHAEDLFPHIDRDRILEAAVDDDQA